MSSNEAIVRGRAHRAGAWVDLVNRHCENQSQPNHPSFSWSQAGGRAVGNVERGDTDRKGRAEEGRHRLRSRADAG